MKTDLMMTEDMRQFSQKYFALLTREGGSKKTDSVSLRLSGYADVGQLMADIVKVCILALGDGEPQCLIEIPEPNMNISSVMSILLDLIPYEEFELLDAMRQEVISPSNAEEEDWDFILASVSLVPPREWLD